MWNSELHAARQIGGGMYALVYCKRRIVNLDTFVLGLRILAFIPVRTIIWKIGRIHICLKKHLYHLRALYADVC